MKHKKVAALLLTAVTVLSVFLKSFAFEHTEDVEPRGTETVENITLAGRGTESEPYLIESLDGLEYFRDSVNDGKSYSGEFVKLTEDIDMSSRYGENEESWTPIGLCEFESEEDCTPFRGTFDGGGHTISNIYVLYGYSTEYKQGLFSGLCGGEIKNLTVSGFVSANRQGAGGIVGYVAGGVVSNCRNLCSVRGETEVGGIVGKNNGGTVECCANEGTIEAESSVSYSSEYLIGGIAGNGTGEGNIKNCYNIGEVAAEAATFRTRKYVGGIIGFLEDGSLANCYNTGEVRSDGDGVGGIAGGRESDGVILNTYYIDTCMGEDTEFDSTDGESKTDVQFAKGEVTYLLQEGVAEEDIYDGEGNTVGRQKPQVWRQTIGTEAYPGFDGKSVYRRENDTYSNSDSAYIYLKDEKLHVCNVKEECVLLIAEYEGGCLVKVSGKRIVTDGVFGRETLGINGAEKHGKLMLWKSISRVQPFCEAVSF